MSKEFPLYPELPQAAAEEAQCMLSKFKEQINKIANETISDLYVNILPYIESDVWNNFRNELVDGFRDYNNRKIQGKYEFKEIRTKIYKDFREEIIKDLNADLVEENERLKKTIEYFQNSRTR
jgi:hypothetical protein